jgi:hypothetical protein
MSLELYYWFAAIGAIATAIIVVFNLLILFIIPSMRRPKFKISFSESSPFCKSIIEGEAPDTVEKARWIRLNVENTGKSIAKQCLAKLVKITSADGQIGKHFDPVQLHWASTDWNTPSPDYHLPTMDLNRGADEFLDLLVTKADDLSIYIGGEDGLFSPEITQRRRLLNKLPQGKYILEVIVYGADVEPLTKYVCLDWYGPELKDFKMHLESNTNKAKQWLKADSILKQLAQ